MLRSAAALVVLVALVPANVEASDHHHHHHHHSSSGHDGGGCDSHSKHAQTTSTAPSPSGTTVSAPAPATTSGARVFVTRDLHRGDLGGIVGATRACQLAADAAGLDGTFQAWLSTKSSNAIEQLQGEGPWLGTNGELAFRERPDRYGPPAEDLRDEHGVALAAGTVIWSGSDLSGRSDGNDCSAWTSTAGNATTGDAKGDALTWGGGGAARPCAASAALICFQQ